MLEHRYAERCGVIVASADFHNATDDDFAHTLADCTSVTEWALEKRSGITRRKLIVEGESSDAHLAAYSLTQLSSRLGMAGIYSLC